MFKFPKLIRQYFQLFDSRIEGVQEKEPNTFEVKVTKSMTKQDVVDKILQEIGGINWDTPSYSLYFMQY